jgi:hypothetical protein
MYERDFVEHPAGTAYGRRIADRVPDGARAPQQ